MIAALASQHSNLEQEEYLEIKDERDVVDHVAQAAAVLENCDCTNSSLFNTFHILFTEQKQKTLDV